MKTLKVHIYRCLRSALGNNEIKHKFVEMTEDEYNEMRKKATKGKIYPSGYAWLRFDAPNWK